MSNFYLCLLLAGLCALASCHHVPGHEGDHDGHEHQHEDQPPAESNEKSTHFPCFKVSPSNGDFAFKFYRHLASESAGKNILFSPVSISIAFMFMTLGAKGITLDQIVSGLSFNQSEISMKEIDDGFRHLLQLLNRPRAEIELSIGNALFTTDKFQVRQEILDEARDLFQANIVSANFKNIDEVAAQINSYIEKKTHGKLVDVVKGLDPETVMVLVNYVFLKAYWVKPFDPESTRKKDFFVNNETTVQVDMMQRDGHYAVAHDEELGCQAVWIPYQGNVTALFILPEKGKLSQVEQAIGRGHLAKWYHSSKLQRIELSLPKVSLRTSYDLKEKMRGLGVTEAFTDRADLSAFTGEPNLKISEAIHKTYLNIHENGTEAAATTVIEMVPMSLPLSIEYNSPYLVVLADHETRTVLFMGRVMNPNEH
uniref:alpha-1-antiproteinase F-like n=1 Tax=Euleptes europaea TaxID=460621 RepID=UPI0025414DA9|nr:alpha-1-antiproteinase F-like [Euleptes europaea]